MCIDWNNYAVIQHYRSNFYFIPFISLCFPYFRGTFIGLPLSSVKLGNNVFSHYLVTPAVSVNSLLLGLCFLYSLGKTFWQNIPTSWRNPYLQPAKITFKTVSHSSFQICLLILQRQIVPLSSATQQKH